MQNQLRSRMAGLQNRLFLAAMAVAALTLVHIAFGWTGILVTAIVAYVVATMALGYWFASTIFAGAVIFGGIATALLGGYDHFMNTMYSIGTYTLLGLATLLTPVVAPILALTAGVVALWQLLRSKMKKEEVRQNK